MAGATTAPATAVALRRRVKRTPVRLGGADIAVTFSAGAAESHRRAEVGGQINAADVALHASKDGGRNRVSVSEARAPIDIEKFIIDLPS